jgi:uncharacterized protein
VKRAFDKFRAALVTLFLAPIRAYQRFISPSLPRRCKYEPTCSAYAVDAVRELGVIRGSILAGWRLLRCNPWSHGGWDPVADRKLFRSGDAEVVPDTHKHAQKHEAHA